MRFPEALEKALDATVTSCRPVGGGCVAEALRATLADGRVVFAKRLGKGGVRGVFEAEATGLEALNAVGEGLGEHDRIFTPRVLHAGADLLVLEWLDLAAGSSTTALRVPDAQWGRCLASFHRASSQGRAARFGFDTHPPLGATPQDNRWLEEWPAFWRDRRLVPMINLLERSGRGGVLVAAGRTLAERIPALLADSDPTPCLLHGDLWSGNRGLCLREGRPRACWFDPAPFVGSREAEFGMTRMFGGFGSGFEAAYHEAWPLPPGFNTRVDVYELHHRLNHLLLFGASYRDGCEGLMARLLRA